MREFKFRAWYKPLGEMVLPDRLESINFETKVLGVYLPIDNKGFNKLRLSDFELLQFTGLKDKNGKEIYDGDIVKHTMVIYTDCSRNEVKETKAPVIGSITFIEGVWLGMKLVTGVTKVLLPGIVLEEELEVIGNIYENAELMGNCP
ncbi:YopX family protein [Paenibacillus thermotolerans]|uniref:YopX family protein n=1 Tax=Paenibacillus thermotolerans TaxID=3027807 RepID=UPI002368B1F7|nr:MULTISPECIES: YopX family protein [unclassified Paenibacillus]